MSDNGEHVLDEAGRDPLTARLSRRGFLGATVGASAGLALGSKLLTPSLVLADDESLVDPTPIPGGDSRHHFFPGRGKEISTINNRRLRRHRQRRRYGSGGRRNRPQLQHR